ncbi:MAG: hypothetical protein A2Y21_04575 [Clostridiales bacterium GWC2_40_7]|nr:MAG: hypothetical protein A2Y21_04575 [Clostridiales bacterium GWC2_40_7]
MIADLHCHSRKSDGSLSAGELAAAAKRLGIQALAIADHDTVDGIEEALEECGKQGIKGIPAIEISGFDYKRNRKAHILGYLMDKPEIVGDVCRPMLEQRQQISRWAVEQIIQEGYLISWELVEGLSKGSTNVYKQHIMHALMMLGYSVSIHDDLYEKFFAKPGNGMPGGIAHREVEYIDAAAAVKLIKEAGGIAVLAHPAGYKNLELIPELVETGLDGLEAWHPSQGEGQVKEIMHLAEKYDLILTGGSDFHGMYEGRANPLGSCIVNEKWLERLYLRRSA